MPSSSYYYVEVFAIFCRCIRGPGSDMIRRAQTAQSTNSINVTSRAESDNYDAKAYNIVHVVQWWEEAHERHKHSISRGPINREPSML